MTLIQPLSAGGKPLPLLVRRDKRLVNHLQTHLIPVAPASQGG